MQRAGLFGLVMVVSACGVSEQVAPLRAQAGRIVVERDAPDAQKPELEAVSRPAQVTCVGDATTNTDAGELMPHLMRVSGWSLDMDDAMLSVSRGPQFPQRADTWLVGGEAKAVSADALSLTAHDGGRSGLFEGAIDVGSGPERLVCWDPIAVFGSPWSAEPTVGAFRARYDWNTGKCADKDGNEGLNTNIPIELVRETAYAECTDLRDVALNGDDLLQPVLSGWFMPGARIEGATLFFADLMGASLGGTAVDELLFGYAVVDGFADQFTTLPADNCTTTTNPWAGTQTTCAR